MSSTKFLLYSLVESDCIEKIITTVNDYCTFLIRSFLMYLFSVHLTSKVNIVNYREVLDYFLHFFT